MFEKVIQGRKIKSVEELEVFKKSHNLTLKIYELTREFPDCEKYGLIPQMRRSSVSICANLIEGGYRTNKKEF